MSLELRRRMLKVEDKDKIEFVVSADNPSISIHGDSITIKSILNGEKIITFIPRARGGTTRIQASEGTKVVLMADSITSFSTTQAKTFVTKKNKSIKEIYLSKCTPLTLAVAANCPSLISFNASRCGGNLLSVDVSNCPVLQNINVSDNGLSYINMDGSNTIKDLNLAFTNINYNIDISEKHHLTKVNVAGLRYITELDTSNNSMLESLQLGYGIYHSSIKHLNLTNNKKLKVLDHSGNSNISLGLLPELDLTQHVDLTSVHVKGVFESIDVSNSPNITSLNIESNNLSTLLLGNKPLLKTFAIASQKITELDVSELSAITSLYVSCAINSIDLSNCIELTSLDLNGSKKIDFVDTSKCAKLQTYTVYNSSISRIDVSKNTELKSINVTASNVKVLDLSYNTNLTSLSCNDSPLEILDISNCPLLFTFKNCMYHNNLNDIRCVLTNDTFTSTLITELLANGAGRNGTIYTNEENSALADACATVGWEIKSLSEAPEL
jgi:hypothetical protein